jgi:1-acyl-sn-glycerol-3-phosphate acyltransferase
MGKNQVISKNKKKLINIGLCLVPRILLLTIGIYVKTEDFSEKDLQIYKKYLGEDYKFDSKPSIMIANHLSWVEIIYNVSLYGGFIAKDVMETVPAVGFIIKACEGMFISRESKDSREFVLEMIQQRQQEYLSGARHTSLFIYPEGTISNGTHLMPFKKGAFKSMLPIKPYVSKPNLDAGNPDLSQSSLPAIIHMIYYTCFLYNNYIIKSLPVINPTEFSQKKNKLIEKEENYETYINTCYNIMLECGEFKKTDKGLKELSDYTNKIIELSKKSKF